jgi:hypothetical protein
MPEIKMSRLVNEYYESVKDNYPNLTAEDFDSIGRSLFSFILYNLQRIDTPTILLKYLGKLKVFSESVSKQIKVIDKQLKFGHISKTRHDEKCMHYNIILQNVLEAERIDNQEVEIIEESDYLN